MPYSLTKSFSPPPRRCTNVLCDTISLRHDSGGIIHLQFVPFDMIGHLFGSAPHLRVGLRSGANHHILNCKNWYTPRKAYASNVDSIRYLLRMYSVGFTTSTTSCLTVVRKPIQFSLGLWLRDDSSAGRDSKGGQVIR